MQDIKLVIVGNADHEGRYSIELRKEALKNNLTALMGLYSSNLERISYDFY